MGSSITNSDEIGREQLRLFPDLCFYSLRIDQGEVIQVFSTTLFFISPPRNWQASDYFSQAQLGSIQPEVLQKCGWVYVVVWAVKRRY